MCSLLDGSVLSNAGHYLSVDSRPVSGTRGILKQITSSYKYHLRSATTRGDNAKIVAPFLCLNIACPPGSYDANVEPAKDDVLFTNSGLLLEIVERWFHSIYGEIEQSHSKPSPRTVSSLKPRGIELLLARKEAPVESTLVGAPTAIGSTLPAPQSASAPLNHTQSRSSPLSPSTFDSSTAAPLYQNSDEISGSIGHAVAEPPSIDETQTKGPPGILPSEGSSIPLSLEQTDFEPSGATVTARGKASWKRSMYAEEEDGEEDLDIDLQRLPRSPVDLELTEDEHVRDVSVSNPWAFAKLNAAMRPSGRSNQLHTPGRQLGDVGHSMDPSSDNVSLSDDPPSVERPIPRVDQNRSSPEAAYPTPTPFPFPQKARRRRKADDASVEASLMPAPSNKEPHKRGALDTWVQRSLGAYDERDHSPDTLQEDQGPPGLLFSRDFVSARSLPPGGTPLSEIPDAPQRSRRRPAPRKQQQDNLDKPFISPVNDPNRVWFDTGENPSQRRPQKARPNNDHRDTAAPSTLTLHDDEIEDDEPVIPAPAQQSLPPIHPDLAITLDYEARKQQAGSAHRRISRQQAAAAAAAAAASKAPSEAPDPLHPQHASTSPHKNRQAKAIAALHTPDTPSSPAAPSLGAEDAAALEPSDPRAYLMRTQGPGEHASASLKGKSRRQKTAMLPFETVSAEAYIGDLTLVVEDVSVGGVEGDMKGSGAWDRYVRSGEVGGGFEGVGVLEVERWEGTLRGLVRGLFAVEGEGEGGEKSVEVDVDLLGIVQVHGAGFA